MSELRTEAFKRDNEYMIGQINTWSLSASPMTKALLVTLPVKLNLSRLTNDISRIVNHNNNVSSFEVATCIRLSLDHLYK